MICFRVFHNIFVPPYKDLSVLTLVENVPLISTKFSEILQRNVSYIKTRSKYICNLQQLLPQKAMLSV